MGSHGAEGNGGGGKLKGKPGMAPPGTAALAAASVLGWADVPLPENTTLLKP